MFIAILDNPCGDKRSKTPFPVGYVSGKGFGVISDNRTAYLLRASARLLASDGWAVQALHCGADSQIVPRSWFR